MFKRFGLILSFAVGMVLLAVLPALAESVDTAWVRRYTGPGNVRAEGHAIAVDGYGNICVIGMTWRGWEPPDYFTMKYSPNGDTAWVRAYDGPMGTTNIARSVALDAPGNVYVTGGGAGYATIKYDLSGDEVWVKRYDGSGNDINVANAIAVDVAGNVYVTGHRGGLSTGFDYATIKYYSNGDTAWVRRCEEGYGNAIAVDNSGNVYVTGGGREYETIKYDSSGNQVWVEAYVGPGNFSDVISDLVLDDSGNVYVTGKSYGKVSSYDYATIKYDTHGKRAWVKRYNGPGDSLDYAKAITVDHYGNVYVTGGSWGPGSRSDFATIKYDASGKQLWVKRYNGPGNNHDWANAIALDDSCNAYVTGYSYGSKTYSDYATMKYSADGDLLWVKRYDGSGYDWANSIALDDSNNVYVTGTGSVTIKYTQANKLPHESRRK
jgi:hypothetical protein